MTVVEGWFAGVKYGTPPSKSQLPDAVANDIIKNICLNSKAFYVEEEGKKTEFVGNRTECALLQLCQKEFGVPYDSVRKQYEDDIVQVRAHRRTGSLTMLKCALFVFVAQSAQLHSRDATCTSSAVTARRNICSQAWHTTVVDLDCKVQMYGFSSAKKMASVLVDQGDGTLRLYNKGASEWVLAVSTAVIEESGRSVPLSEGKKAELLEIVTQMASRGLRTLVRRLMFRLVASLPVCTSYRPAVAPGDHRCLRITLVFEIRMCTGLACCSQCNSQGHTLSLSIGAVAAGAHVHRLPQRRPHPPCGLFRRAARPRPHRPMHRGHQGPCAQRGAWRCAHVQQSWHRGAHGDRRQHPHGAAHCARMRHP